MKSIKKVLCLLLTVLLLVSTITPVMANNNIKVVIDGKQIAFDVPPQAINNRTMVPLRAIFEALGATVDWNGDTQTITSTKGNTTIKLAIDSLAMIVNEDIILLDTPPCAVNGRTLVPVRAISEAFGTTVDWDANTNSVLIKTFVRTFDGYQRLVDYIKRVDPQYEYSADCNVGSTSLSWLAGGGYGDKTSASVSNGYHLFRLTFSEDCITSTYELRKRTTGTAYSDVVLTGSFENASITDNSTTLPYDDWGYDSSEMEYALKMLKTILNDMCANLAEVPVSDLGFVNYSGKTNIDISMPEDYKIPGYEVTYSTTTLGSSELKIYSTNCVRGEEANRIMAEASTLNDTPGRYKEWVILDFYIEHISSTFGDDELLDASLLISNNLYAENGQIDYYASRGYLPDGYKSINSAKCLPGESMEFSIAVLVDKGEKVQLKVPNKKYSKTSWLVCDGSQKVDTKSTIEYYNDGKAPTYTSITGVALIEFGTGGIFKYKYTSEADLLKYHQALFDRDFEVEKEDGDRVIFVKYSPLGRHSVDIRIEKDGKEVWVKPVSVYSTELDF